MDAILAIFLLVSPSPSPAPPVFYVAELARVPQRDCLRARSACPGCDKLKRAAALVNAGMACRHPPAVALPCRAGYHLERQWGAGAGRMVCHADLARGVDDPAGVECAAEPPMRMIRPY